ncbi:hypothetical protein [Hominenteromicrobium sp.]|uniref:hypothetical protein n=1 Tax=Hominenteromicrobium sp. TaxID=3073581 RepID=UPI003AF06C5D
MKTYYLHITYKDISGKSRPTHICTEIDADTARRLVKAVGKTLSHVGGNGVEVDHRAERGMVIIARVSTAPDRAYLTGAPYYAEHDISLTPAERAAAAAWREHIATIETNHII